MTLTFSLIVKVLIAHYVFSQNLPSNSSVPSESSSKISNYRARDLPVPHAQFGAKTFLKNKLLDNLNSFFGTNRESLEMLDSQPSELGVDEDKQMRAKPTDIPNIMIGGFRRGKPLDRFHFDDSNTHFPTLIPSLIPTSTTTTQIPDSEKTRSEGRVVSEQTADTIRKWRKRLYKAFKGRPSQKRSETIVRITDETRPTPESSEILQFNDDTPLVVDKNRQLLLSRKLPSWNLQGTKQIQTFGKDPQGKMVPLFGLEKASPRSNRMVGAPAQLPETFGMNPLRDTRLSYKTANQRSVAYLPSSGMNPTLYTPEPATVHLVTATAPPYISGPSLVQPGAASQMSFRSYGTGPAAMNGASSTDYSSQTSFGSMPSYGMPASGIAPNYNALPPTNYNAIPAYAPQPITMPSPNTNTYSGSGYNAVQPALPESQAYQIPSYNNGPLTPIVQMPTLPPISTDMSYMSTLMTNIYTTAAPITFTTEGMEDRDLQDEEDDEMFGPPIGMTKECVECSSDGQIISEEKCNSMRLRTIIQNNIVPNDADASKRSVQQAAESETGTYFDAICGTGFFSYIAHTDEFCLASSMGVNCYVFSPVCSGTNDVSSFGKTRKSYLKHNRRKTFVNKN